MRQTYTGIRIGVKVDGESITGGGKWTPALNSLARKSQELHELNKIGVALSAQRDINKFYDYLGLNLAQREQMRKIGEETRREFRELRDEAQPKFDAIREASRIKIRALLNNEQLKKYEEFRRKMDERRKNQGGDLKVPDFYRDGGGPRLD